jgi:hypothetical protein
VPVGPAGLSAWHTAGQITSSRMLPTLRPSACLAQVDAGPARAGTEATERLPHEHLVGFNALV